MDLLGGGSEQQRQRPPKQKEQRRAEESSSSEAAAAICLNEDLCTEIFRFLPVKSILKFKTLSKAWHSILSSKSFRQNHACTHHTDNPVGLFFLVDDYNMYGRLSLINTDCSDVFYTIPLLKQPDDYLSPSGIHPITCTSSCNGLQLFRIRIPNRNSPDHMYYIYNPTTKESKPLLDIPPHIRMNKFVCASLAFDPCHSLDYKIIFLCLQNELSNTYRIEVYSSAKGICKVPQSNIVVGRFSYDDIHGVFCNGAIYWLSEDAARIVYFNVHTGCIKDVPTPCLTDKIQYFGESHGYLHLVISYHTYFYKSSVLDVYELKGDYSGWFLKYQVDFASTVSMLPHQGYPCLDKGAFMSIFRHEEDDDSNMVLLLCGKYWVEYNFKTKKTKMLCEYDLYSLREPWTSHFPWTYGFNTHQFIPTPSPVYDE